MITPKEAKKNTQINFEKNKKRLYKQTLKKIDKAIRDAAKEGKDYTSVLLDSVDAEFCGMIKRTVSVYGYCVIAHNYITNTSLFISWAKEE